MADWMMAVRSYLASSGAAGGHGRDIFPSLSLRSGATPSMRGSENPQMGSPEPDASQRDTWVAQPHYQPVAQLGQRMDGTSDY